MTKRPKGADEHRRLPDDNKEKRSIDVPDEIWAHVERWAEREGKSRAAVVRECISMVANERIAEANVVDSVYAFVRDAIEIQQQHLFVFENLKKTEKSKLSSVRTMLSRNAERLRMIDDFVLSRFHGIWLESNKQRDIKTST